MVTLSRILRGLTRREGGWGAFPCGAIRVTPRQWLPLGLALVFGILASHTGRELFWRLLYLVILIELVAFVGTAYNISTFRLERRCITPRTHVGQVAEERFWVQNTGRLTKVWVEVRDASEMPAHHASRVLNALGAKRRWSWNVRTVCRRWNSHLPCSARG